MKPHNFRTWQHWRWAGGGQKETSDEKDVKKIHSSAEKDKYDCPAGPGAAGMGS